MRLTVLSNSLTLTKMADSASKSKLSLKQNSIKFQITSMSINFYFRFTIWRVFSSHFKLILFFAISFLQMLLPCTDNLLRNISLDRPSHRVGRYDNLPRDIELALLEIIEKEIDLQRRQDILKRDLELRYDFSTLSAFRSVDKYNDGRVDPMNLGSFLRSCGHYATETELLAIIRRIDTDGDARLSYAEFAEFLRTSNPPNRSVVEEAERAERAASAERFRRR